MGQITADQSQTVMSILTTNVKWSEIDFKTLGLQDAVIRDPKGAGKQFEAFLRNGCRMNEDFFRETGELSIEIPARKRPTFEELREKYGIRSIERDNSTEEAVTLKLATVLRTGEDEIDGKEYERRLVSKPDGILGYQQREWLLEHQDENPAFMALLGKIYIDFSGIVLVFGGGGRGVPYCGQDGSRWDGDWISFDSRFGADARVAVAGKCKSVLGHSTI
jgi:hypothetical protein